MQKSETKRVNFTFDKKEVFHNNFDASYCATVNATMPLQGTADTNRIGDEINVLGFKIKVFCGQKGDRSNVNWRMFAFYHPKGTTPTVASVFRTSIGNNQMEELNTDRIRPVFDRKYRPNQAGLTGTGNDEFTFYKEFYIPANQVYKFGPQSGASGHNKDDLYFSVMGFDAFGTITTDNIGYYQVWSEVVYKDI